MLACRLPNGKRDILFDVNYSDTWKAMEQLYMKGKAKAIGVSNLSVPKLERLMQTAEIVPAVNQIELHPLCPQQEIVDYCQKEGILVQAYSPLGSRESPL
jgi:glycerol 2-dehydrogenase (NADP+)